MTLAISALSTSSLGGAMLGASAICGQIAMIAAMSLGGCASALACVSIACVSVACVSIVGVSILAVSILGVSISAAGVTASGGAAWVSSTLLSGCLSLRLRIRLLHC